MGSKATRQPTPNTMRWNNRTFGIQLDPKSFAAYEGERLIATKFYGEKVIVK